ncbi:hypothetical protein [Luteipulveratus mongoliensis]|uniref:hypothetical protein n=1 Tax=Luteipulveratus mongoliensis TaxID=571913 RepID=UPI0012ECE72C|nr:hypothetical protein [Luteipulveratus mongoliensis]
MQLPLDDDLFESYSAPDGSWAGPGQVVHPDYHQFYFAGPREEMAWNFDHDLIEADPLGNVVVSTVCRMGPVAVLVDVRDQAPGQLDRNDGWEAVEQISIPVIGDRQLESWGGGPIHPVDITPGDYELRAHRRTWGAEYDTGADRVHEFYLLQLWPAASGVSLTTTARARVEAAERERQDEEARRWQAWDDSVAAEHRRTTWGGREPSPSLEAVGPESGPVARADWQLANAIAEANEEQQRRIAVWAVREAIQGLPTDVVDFGIALEALADGRTLPPPFDDESRVHELLFPGPTRVEIRRVTAAEMSERSEMTRPPIAREAAALAAIRMATGADPAVAAMGALSQAAAGQSDRAAFWSRAHEFVLG